MSTEVRGEAPPRKEKALTIGAVCKQLEREFPEISISKIRYLEDQKLIAPRRTPAVPAHSRRRDGCGPFASQRDELLP